VDEVERPLWEAVGANVVMKDIEIRSIDRFEEVELEVRGSHMPARADAVDEPTGDRPVSPADLETPGTGSDPEPLDTPDRQRVQTFLKQFETT
jgi:hypothetical protein